MSDPKTLASRFEVAARFAREIGGELPLLVDDMSNGMMAAYDAYPFRVYAIDASGVIAVASDKGAAGFSPTLARIDAWLAGSSSAPAHGVDLQAPVESGSAGGRVPAWRRPN